MKIKRAICLLMAALFVMAMTPAMAAAACTHFAPAANSDCIVCKVAAMINALPAKDAISIDNAADVIDQIHAIDRVKFDLSEEQYEELLLLVDKVQDASGGGLSVPKHYVEAVEKINSLTNGGWLEVGKKFVAPDGTTVDVSNAEVKFEITGTTAENETFSQTLTLFDMGSMVSDFYAANMEGDGWTYKYLLPAGTYTIEEISDKGATVDGKPFITGSTTYELNGEEIAEGSQIEVKAGESIAVLVMNAPAPTVIFHSNYGSDTTKNRYFIDGEKQTLEEKFSRTGYTFSGWNTQSDGKGSSYSDGQEVELKPGDKLHLYAQWEKEVSDGSVTFNLGDLNGVSGCVLDFGTREAGYSGVPAQKVAFVNNSYYKAGVSCSENNDYTVSSNFTLEVNETGTFEIKPKNGLSAGAHNESLYITVSFYESDGSISTASPNPLTVKVKFKVTAPTAAPTATPTATPTPTLKPTEKPTEEPQVTPKPTEKPASSGIDLWYNGGNSFGTSKPAVPTSVEIDGKPVAFTGNGSEFTVSCVPADADWVTVRWNSTSVTKNFTPDAVVSCTDMAIPKTGDMPLRAAIAAFLGF